MDEIDNDVALAVKLAVEAGYDVTIKATPTVDGKPGRVSMPMAMMNMVADAKGDPSVACLLDTRFGGE